MEKILLPIPRFETVFLLNGVFSQNGAVTLKDNEIIYLTVLPLSAMYIPYTVKIVGRKITSNNDFCALYSLDTQTDIAVLKPRNILVYYPQRTRSDSVPIKFFETVKSGRAAAARILMTEELKNSIDDESLFSFFDEFSDIVPASYIDKGSDKFILCRKDGTASYYNFSYKQGLIDDITQIE